VSAPLSSGPVVAPLHMVPHADDAVASLGSVSPARLKDRLGDQRGGVNGSR
jgi:hypothetical protein